MGDKEKKRDKYYDFIPYKDYLRFIASVLNHVNQREMSEMENIAHGGKDLRPYKGKFPRPESVKSLTLI